ncbi:MAG: hypothetical protein U1E73_09005 [Planctomycetota bacterium]
MIGCAEPQVPSVVPFWVSFLTTVCLLVAALATGLLHRRRAHLVLGPLVMVALGVTVFLTEELMRKYDFPAEALRTHLWFAKAGGLLALPVIVTGVWLWRRPRARFAHRLTVWIWLLSVLAATGTGLWIFALGTVKPV